MPTIQISRLLAILFAGPLLVLSPTSAQDAQGPTTAGWHFVRPGETLESIARQYLGRSGAWREVVQINPSLADPDTLSPGERIQVQLNRGLPSAVSQVGRLAGSVNEQPRPVEWTEGRQFDLLEEGDGIRTFGRSSVELIFADTTRLMVTEDSLIFIRSKAPVAQREHPGEIEIVRGQADLTSGEIRRPEKEAVEIVLGHARIRTAANPQGDLSARSRRQQTGQAQIMVFRGQGEVEAHGAKVAVDEGFGTAIPADGPAAPPEPLLAAPILVAPAAGARFATSSPTFLWQPVEDAKSYVVEVCSDEDCGRLISRKLQVTMSSLTEAELLQGSYFWRVTAIGGNGLDGYPSQGRPLLLVPEAEATPRGAIAAEGAQALLTDGRLILGPEARIVVHLDDPADTAKPRLSLDGHPLPEDQAQRWSPGAHEVSGVVVDAAGNPSPLRPLVFVSDPEPPEITWSQKTSTPSASKKGPRPWKRVGLDWSPDGKAWKPVIPSKGPETDIRDGVLAEIPIQEELFLRRRRRRPFARDAGPRPGRREVIHILASDSKADLQSFALQILDRDGAAVLRLKAEDKVGNTAVTEWPLARCRFFCGPKLPSTL